MGFESAFATARDVPGWLTEAQARILFDTAAAVGGPVVEIGSHHGRSTLVLAAAAPVVAVDPFPSDWRYGGDGTEQRLRANLEAAGLTDRVDVRVATSRTVRQGWTAAVGLVYVDGKHDYWSAGDDLRWAEHLRPGGVLLVHDAFSSLGVTLALLRHLLPSRRLAYRGRTGSLARFERATPSAADRARMLTELPWFARNLVIKAALRVARLAGHRSTPDPY
ncbi:MAG TPA: class I SAM-dependent methyltransferase [Propionibacteriaceae bacterium]|nr:class I SAM-dependent methyltransferase [Propionibacteriaceae bacterium]